MQKIRYLDKLIDELAKGKAMGALLSADTLAGEISSGSIQTIVTKPLRRSDVVLGKGRHCHKSDHSNGSALAAGGPRDAIAFKQRIGHDTFFGSFCSQCADDSVRNSLSFDCISYRSQHVSVSGYLSFT